MSLSRRLIDLARSNLNSLLERATTSDLERYSDDELAAELELRQDRKRRQAEARAARHTAERAARERAEARTTEWESRVHARGDARGPVPGASPDRSRLAALYQRLETPVGADLDAVKHNFRRLVRASHPDLHGGTPDQQRAANERTKRLTAAYDELERILTRQGY